MLPVVHLGQGKSFGELALAYDPKHPYRVVTRQASILCLENCKFATMNKNDYIEILQKIDQKRKEALIKFF